MLQLYFKFIIVMQEKTEQDKRKQYRTGQKQCNTRHEKNTGQENKM